MFIFHKARAFSLDIMLRHTPTLMCQRAECERSSAVKNWKIINCFFPPHTRAVVWAPLSFPSHFQLVSFALSMPQPFRDVWDVSTFYPKNRSSHPFVPSTEHVVVSKMRRKELSRVEWIMIFHMKLYCSWSTSPCRRRLAVVGDSIKTTRKKKKKILLWVAAA